MFSLTTFTAAIGQGFEEALAQSGDRTPELDAALEQLRAAVDGLVKSAFEAGVQTERARADPDAAMRAEMMKSSPRESATTLH
jgi:hypothetical protein